ncbi:serine/threonine protein kinase [Nonomuraea sp. NN258]|uniref:serine/threonine protein kinase n=1 Tax=Nonomuraea antri TaxID=2730852 RepID=UPI0015698DB9|nr:serine/threonine-protein kinase [Nonomuraea antri]NRQ33934.1 serine/threonine protein kinase [Nonomuraea antri]
MPAQKRAGTFQSQMSPPGDPLKPDDPRRIGPYRLAHRLGAGGMGVVYAGVDPSGQRAAVKVVHRELAHDPDFRSRFAREITLLRRVNGRCTVRVLAADADATRPWLATEYAPGPTLAQRLADNGPLAGDDLLGLAAGLAEALRVLHAVNVVHRDLKPSNVILSPAGPKLVDMGIARALGETSITRTGMVIGSAGWISPEEYRGEEIGPAADVHGWGVLILHAATGRLPYGNGRPEVLAHRILSEDPAGLAELSEPLRGLVTQAVAKMAGERPRPEAILCALIETNGKETGLAEEVTWLLERTWLMPSDDEPWTSSARRLRVAPLLIAGLCLTAVAVGTAIVAPKLLQPSPPNAPVRATTIATAPAAAPATPSAAPSEQPATTPSASQPKRTQKGRRVTMTTGFSFVLPAEWLYFPDPTVNPDNMCLRPRDKEKADYWYCHQFGMSILPWEQPDGSFDPREWADPDELNRASDGEPPCGDVGLSRKGKMLANGLHNIGSLRAHHRKARSYCRDGTRVETEYLHLPVTGLTIVIDKLSAQRRAQVEGILRSFTFPGKS